MSPIASFCEILRFRLFRQISVIRFTTIGWSFFPLFEVIVTSEFRSVWCRLAFQKIHKKYYLRIEYCCINFKSMMFNIFSGSQKFYLVSRENLRWKPYCSLLGIVGVIYRRREILSDQCANHCDVTRLYFDWECCIFT